MYSCKLDNHDAVFSYFPLPYLISTRHLSFRAYHHNNNTTDLLTFRVQVGLAKHMKCCSCTSHDHTISIMPLARSTRTQTTTFQSISTLPHRISPMTIQLAALISFFLSGPHVATIIMMPGQPYAIHRGTRTQKPRQFACPNCPSQFTYRNNLYYHCKFECGQLPRFACPYCDYRARHSSNTRAHVKRKHPDCRVYTIDVCKMKFDH